jgi:hypothetical protein
MRIRGSSLVVQEALPVPSSQACRAGGLAFGRRVDDLAHVAVGDTSTSTVNRQPDVSTLLRFFEVATCSRPHVDLGDMRLGTLHPFIP